MKSFSKPAIDIPAHLALPKQRGFTTQGEGEAHCFLIAVSFFRPTPYMRPVQLSEDAEHDFKPTNARRRWAPHPTGKSIRSGKRPAKRTTPPIQRREPNSQLIRLTP
jgi:hypothetical protein